MHDSLPDHDAVLAQFNRLIQELLRGNMQRNTFRPWEVELLLDEYAKRHVGYEVLSGAEVGRRGIDRFETSGGCLGTIDLSWSVHRELDWYASIEGAFGTLRLGWRESAFKLTTADDIAAELTGAILKDLSLKPGQEVILLVNGFGGTPLLEQYVMVHAALKVLAGAGVKAVRHLTGSFVTSLEMAGCSITVSAVDSNALALWDAPVHTAALRWGM